MCCHLEFDRIPSGGSGTMFRCVILACCLAAAAGIPADISAVSQSEDGKGFLEKFSISGWFRREPTMEKKEEALCEVEDWRKSSMKLLLEMPATGLFEDLKGTVKWEISGMAMKDSQVHDTSSPRGVSP